MSIISRQIWPHGSCSKEHWDGLLAIKHAPISWHNLWSAGESYSQCQLEQEGLSRIIKGEMVFHDPQHEIHKGQSQ